MSDTAKNEMPCARRGLTLAEMLVVLVIMAILTTVAVQSMGPVAEQGRIQATRRTLEQIRSAIIGTDPNIPGYTPTGFVADHGRLPADWLELAPYFRPLVGDTSPRFLDGWSKEFAPLSVDPTTGILRIESPTNAQYFLQINPTDWQATSVQVSLTGVDARSSQQTQALQTGAWTFRLLDGRDAQLGVHQVNITSGSTHSFTYSSAELPQGLPMGNQCRVQASYGANSDPMTTTTVVAESQRFSLRPYAATSVSLVVSSSTQPATGNSQP